MAKTYYSDVQEVAHSKDPKKVSRIIAEERREESRRKKKQALMQQNAWYTGGGLLLLAIGIGALLLIIFWRGDEGARPGTTPPPETLIYAEEHAVLDISDSSHFKILTTISQELQRPLPAGNIEHIFFTKRLGVRSGRLGAQGFLQALDTQIPSTLGTILEPLFTYGFFSDSVNRPFVIFQVTSFDDAFIGMRSWEATLFEDVRELLGIGIMTLEPNFYTLAFADEIIDNHDVRTLRDDAGNLVLFYTFLDARTLVIATHENTLAEIIERLANRETSARIER